MGLFSSVGSFVNDVFGATSSSNQAFKQSKYFANQSYQQQKEFAQNAHQWEMEDLQKAGLNPALTTGASSAGAIAGGGSTGGQGVTGTPVDIMSSIGNFASNIANAKNMNENAMRVKELLGGEKAIQNKTIQLLENQARNELSSAKYNERRSSGKGWSINTPWGGGGYKY